MATTVSNGSTTITPDLVLDWRSSSQAGTVVHPILGAPDPDVTLRAATMRAGTLRMFFTTPAAAAAAEALHRALGTWTLTSSAYPFLNMRYVVAGAVELANADPGARRWTLDVGYQQVST